MQHMPQLQLDCCKKVLGDAAWLTPAKELVDSQFLLFMHCETLIANQYGAVCLGPEGRPRCAEI